MKKNAIFVIPGICRTFIDCFDSIYENLILGLFDENYDIYLYLYLKLNDPGPKKIEGYNFAYNKIKYEELINYINEIKNKYPKLNIDYKIIKNNEISDNEIMLQVKNRNLYQSNNYSRDDILLRGLQQHYNFEQCGLYLLNKEKSINKIFDYIIYLRPDLYFTHKCDKIDTYNNDKISIAKFYYGINYNECYEYNDYCAIIPRSHLDSFFSNKMKIYRNNENKIFKVPEDIFFYDIDYEIKDIGKYIVKRDIIL